MILGVIDGFRHENKNCTNFHYDIRNQRVKIHKYMKFKKSHKSDLCGSRVFIFTLK